VHTSDVAAALQSACLRAIRSNEIAELEYQLHTGSGVQEFEARLVRRDDEAAVGIVRNVTKRNSAARMLQESEDRFRGAFDHSAIGVALVDPGGRFLRANAALSMILGYSEAELCKTTFQALSHPDDLPANLELKRRVLAGETTHFEMEKRYIHKDGHTITALLTTSLVRDAAGDPLYFVSQVQDLTERVRARAEIERLHLELAHSGRVALMGQLTASLAHELLQPITAVLANAEAGQRLAAAGRAGSGQMVAYLDDIVESSHRAGDVIDRVRGLLKKERSPRRRLSLNQLVREVSGVMHSDLVSRSVRLVLQLDPELPEVTGDAVELQQVILNLMLNGADALSATDPANRQLVVSTINRQLEVELDVQDCGAGIEPALLQRIFEPFFSTKPNGMGMGLAICSEIVQAHGGRMWARNNADCGLSVCCSLPKHGAA
jgi:two-component system sensor kinase FixL